MTEDWDNPRPAPHAMSHVAPTALNAHLWARDEFDFYVEPEWCSRRLFAEVHFDGRILDPACGLGRIVEAAAAAGHTAWGSDIRPIGFRAANPFSFIQGGRDFLDEGFTPPRDVEIVCNPPFKHAEDFVEKALRITSGKVAMLLPSTWRCGAARARWLATTPLYRVLDLTPRPSMPPGAVVEAGEKPGGGTKDFAWYIWLRGYEGPYQGGWLHRDVLP